jgi:hypothetical protein
VTVPPEVRAGRLGDGTPWLVVADTAWAVPGAGCAGGPPADRRDKGFNAALLMTVRPGYDFSDEFHFGLEVILDALGRDQTDDARW